MSQFPPEIQGPKLIPPHHPGLGLVRVTEAAALTAGRWMGLGAPSKADHAAQEAMAAALNLLPMQGAIISGEEGRLHEETRLSSGSRVGQGEGPEMDVELNAIDGAGLVSEGAPGAISVAALAPRGSMWRPGPAVYLEKLVVDSEVAPHIGPEALDAPPAWTLALVARHKQKAIRDLVVFVLKRRRHERLIEEIRRSGARVFLREDGDVAGALMAGYRRGEVDVLMGVGGSAECLAAACAVKVMGGEILARSAPQSPEEKAACAEAGLDTRQVLRCEDLVSGDSMYFSATGITDSVILDGVHYHGHIVTTHSLVLRHETQTRREIKTEHRMK
ncbi:fructose-bisphosphatase class II [bacterium DOLZORAL124_64_63]|nr:MAG: fructose-bisphosphatase class II [bacterium DOLZORAL124_64_63]